VVLLCTYNPSSGPISTFKEIHQMFKPEEYVLYFYLSSKHETFSNLHDAFLLFSSVPGMNPSLNVIVLQQSLSSSSSSLSSSSSSSSSLSSVTGKPVSKVSVKKCLISGDECRRQQDHFHIQYAIPTWSTMFLLINYCSDMFRPQFLANGRELISLCSLYVNSSGRSFYILYTIKIIIKTGLKYWNP
jgi:hypothetical protein